MTPVQPARPTPRCRKCGATIEMAKVLVWPDGVGTVLCDVCGMVALLDPEDGAQRCR